MRSHLLEVIRFSTSDIALITTATQIRMFERFDKPENAKFARDSTIMAKKVRKTA